MHLKNYKHEYNLSQRLYKNIKENIQFKHPIEILLEDAKAALSIMYAVFITKLSAPHSFHTKH